MTERIIKSNERVKEHGEVFTPRRIVNLMLNQKELKAPLSSLSTTFLEPAAGEGAFLTEILRRKMLLAVRLSNDLDSYEQNSLIALCSLYGIELMEDNVKLLAMNMYQTFFNQYSKEATKYGGKVNTHVIESAKVIISANMAEGDALKQITKDGQPIILSEWKLLPIKRNIRKVHRIEYTLTAIINNEGPVVSGTVERTSKQLSLFADDDHSETSAAYEFLPVKITEVYKQKMIKTEPL
ncbi:N-6 DNA methylase [Schleiferilactobacillus perolens]|uniref:site-specific DNA-methyltransferase (adenine-specific) n=1 Tax=Schleiferilactobacillus perolens DSM 12744 TaxID=1423792 RepID=A0A0R1N3R8_9LACO|nr:N-6 DNA methylase [Schleiferilactobacillus perolens]KRL14620.1 methylase [Schleiferilactobacillus perolens DSM 12744]